MGEKSTTSERATRGDTTVRPAMPGTRGDAPERPAAPGTGDAEMGARSTGRGRIRRALWGTRHTGHTGGLDILRWIGPGLLVTVGFIDPGNWATNMAAGSTFGYALLWVVTLSTLMLIVLQHNVAHLGIVTGQ